MRDRGANGPRDRGNKEASNAAVSARRTGSQEPKAAFSLFVLSFLYSLLTDSARQAGGQKPGARSFFPVPCSLGPCRGPRRQVFVAGVACSLLFPHPPVFLPHPLPPASPLPAFPLSVPLLPWSLVHCFLPTPPYISTPTPHAVL